MLEKYSRQGVVHCKCCTCTTGACWIPVYLQSDWGNLVPSINALLISLRLKNGEGVEAQCLIIIGKIKKEKKYVGLKIKLSERRAHCIYVYLYKSKYSTINIKFSYLNFKNMHPHVQNNVRNGVQHKKTKQTNKQEQNKKQNKHTKKGGKYNCLLPTSP